MYAEPADLLQAATRRARIRDFPSAPTKLDEVSKWNLSALNDHVSALSERLRAAEKQIERLHELYGQPAAPPQAGPITIEAIKRFVCANFGLTNEELIGASKASVLLLPRHVAIYLCARLTKWGSSDIGRRFNRDHTTILHSIKHIKRMRERDPEVDAVLARLEAQIRGEKA